MKKFLSVLALFVFGASAAVACPGDPMKEASSDAAVPQQSQPAATG